MIRKTAVLLAILLALGAGPGWTAMTSSPSGIDSRLRFEWETGTRSGHPTVTGFIYNSYMRAANNVRLLVETLDASGQVVDKSYGWVTGIVPVFGRSYFEVPVKTAGASYRISVTSFEWRDGG